MLEHATPPGAAAGPAATAAGTLLETVGLNVFYGKNQVLKSLSLRVAEGEVVALVGSNAAGKTTTLRTLMGLKESRSGEVRIGGENVSGMSTVDCVRRGMVLVPEGRQCFTRFTVLENLVMGAYHRADRDRIGPEIEAVFGLFPRLAERRKQLAGSMSGGEQQMLAIGRGLLQKPRFLLLDEPALGLAPIIVEEIESTIHKLAASGMTILLAEQNAALALRLANRAYVLESGRISASGTSHDLNRNASVRRLYLGH